MKTTRILLFVSLGFLGLVLSTSHLGMRVDLPKVAMASTEIEYRTVFVPAPVLETNEDTGWKQIDEKELTEDVRQALDKLGYEGFEIIEVIAITRGRLDTGGVRHGTWGGGYGVTQGLMIIAKGQAG